MSKKCTFDLICGIRETKEAPKCTRAGTTTSTHTVSTPRRRFNLLESLAWQFNFPNDKRDKTNFAQMETEVEIDVGQESFPTRKVGQISSLSVRDLDKAAGRG